MTTTDRAAAQIVADWLGAYNYPLSLYLSADLERRIAAALAATNAIVQAARALTDANGEAQYEALRKAIRAWEDEQ